MNKVQEKLNEISCAPECGFVVRSHDKDEVVNLAKLHIDQKHPGMKVSREDLRAKAKSI
jgi:predicted small metal-binding protein